VLVVSFMVEPYGRTRRALLNKPGIFSRPTTALRILGHLTGEALSRVVLLGDIGRDCDGDRAVHELVFHLAPTGR
jgi:hypothetical protein